MSAICLEEYRRDRSASRALPSLSTLGVLDIAALWHRDPENALRLADESRAAFDADRIDRAIERAL